MSWWSDASPAIFVVMFGRWFSLCEAVFLFRRISMWPPDLRCNGFCSFSGSASLGSAWLLTSWWMPTLQDKWNLQGGSLTYNYYTQYIIVIRLFVTCRISVRVCIDLLSHWPLFLGWVRGASPSIFPLSSLVSRWPRMTPGNKEACN